MDTQQAARLEPYEIAQQATHTLRDLARATNGPSDHWQYPMHVSMTLSALAAAAECLMQTIGQCAEAPRRAHRDGHLYCKTGTVDTRLDGLGVDLAEAAAAARALGDRLRSADSWVSLLGYKD